MNYGPIKVASVLYQLLLYLYPAAFRREFGREMALIFRDSSRMAMERGGPAGLMSMWSAFAWDLIATALVERLREVTNMTTLGIARVAGLGGILAGLIFVIGIVVAFSGGELSSVQDYIRILATAWMIFLTIALYVQGVTGSGAKLALAGIALGLVLMVASGIFYAIDFDPENAEAFGSEFFGLLIQGLSMAALGLWLRKTGESPAWGMAFIIVGMLMGLTWPAIFLLGGMIGLGASTLQEWSDLIYIAPMLFQGIAWIMLGGLAVLGSGQPSNAPFQPAG